MLELLSIEALQIRFGDRFDGMSLTHVETLHWPIWRHALTYTSHQSVILDPLEEGLLLLLKAGVRSIAEAALLLGCSEHYAREMSERLAAGGAYHSSLQISGPNTLVPSVRTDTVLNTRERQVASDARISLLRDAIFGDWLSFGDTAFEISPSPNPEDGPFRWLGPTQLPTTEDEDAGPYALSLIAEKEVGSSKLEVEGDLQWVTLWLGCYQPSSGARGRYLLFNPACDDTPLLDLSMALEQDLGRRSMKLYFPDGSLHTSQLFWEAISDRTAAERKTEELQSNRAHLTELLAQKHVVRQNTFAPPAQRRSAATAARGGTGYMQPPMQEDRSLKNDSLLAAEKAVSAAKAKIADLERQLAEAPRIEHLEAHQHPAVLRAAIQHSRSLLILICPWIRIRVLRPLLPEIDAAIKRGVHILIGYGMPKSRYHTDSTDEEALVELRQRQIGQKLWLVHLNTHEKVMLQDDELFVNSSFNFFSYTGGDNRRESGTLQRGGVSQLREKFVSAFPEHIRQLLLRT